MSSSQDTGLKIVFGAMTFGRPNTLSARVHTADEAAKIVDVFQKHRHSEIDTARTYGDSSTEEILAELDWQKRGIPEDVRKALMSSLKALKCDKVNMFYLHGPDRKTPFEDTLREVNKLYEEGYFKRFGIGNYIISLYAFQPLAGGFLTGRYKRDQTEFEPGSRFDPKIWQGRLHRGRYWNDSYFDAIDIIRSGAENHGLTDAEVALRWLEHHSQMKKELNNAIIIGASSTKHLEENLADLEKGPLLEDVVQALETAWLKVKAVAPKYWH
ncbi:hypothetical protein H2201_003140 [Coniosporium apollinis]|uniref:NADP-dependent oxidoreductase domain-containing protein n=1 Tax=Coniosporium apollinis TaxID=61459 RepID=A0ABQ9NWK5_9PEZI|nr:hypothetical protein H2201_003140 [Coniosporium apollinis]